MKKLAMCLMMLSLGLFAVGCGETADDTATDPVAPAGADHDAADHAHEADEAADEADAAADEALDAAADADAAADEAAAPE